MVCQTILGGSGQSDGTNGARGPHNSERRPHPVPEIRVFRRLMRDGKLTELPPERLLEMYREE